VRKYLLPFVRSAAPFFPAGVIWFLTHDSSLTGSSFCSALTEAVLPPQPVSPDTFPSAIRFRPPCSFSPPACHPLDRESFFSLLPPPFLQWSPVRHLCLRSVSTAFLDFIPPPCCPYFVPSVGPSPPAFFLRVFSFLRLYRSDPCSSLPPADAGESYVHRVFDFFRPQFFDEGS